MKSKLLNIYKKYLPPLSTCLWWGGREFKQNKFNYIIGKTLHKYRIFITNDC